jgi:uncharacterized phage protein (TIGR01671 family)
MKQAFHSNNERSLRMDKIKFRGKRIDNGEWVYGYYAEASDDEVFIITWYGWNITCCMECGENETETYQIIPETTGQYIGRKDKNENEIYEGDIVTDGVNNYIVIFHEGAWRLRLCRDYNSLHDLYPVANHREIIGNIYDNPELLEDKV